MVMSSCLAKDSQMKISMIRYRRNWIAIVCMTIACMGFCGLPSSVSFGQVAEPDLAGQGTTLGVEKNGDPLTIPVTAFGVTKKFLLDSGASIHVLDKVFEPHMGEQIAEAELSTAGADVIAKAYESPRLMIGASSLDDDFPVISFDLTPASHALGHDLAGVIGAPIFLQYIVAIDFDQGFVQLLDRNEPPRDSWGIPIQVRVDPTGRAFIDNVKIGSAVESFVLDTGMNGSISITNDIFNHLVATGEVEPTRLLRSHTASGDVTHQSGVVDSIHLGPFHNNSVLVFESSSNKIGLGYLSRFRIKFDVSRKRIYLSEGANFSKTDEDDNSGLYLKWINNQVVVVAVDESSPAQRAGIVKDDIVIGINGESATGTRLNEIRRHFKKLSNEEQSISILRGQQELNVRFFLQDVRYWDAAREDVAR